MFGGNKMKRSNWYRLDNSAKIMPSTTTNLNTNVFRLTCTLLDNVVFRLQN